jgi:hypothetical protein
MLSSKVIRTEHMKAVSEMDCLVRAAKDHGYDFPIDHDYELYCRLTIIKNVLEWVDTSLVKTAPNGRGRIEQLIGDCHYYGLDGPVSTEMIKRRL